MRFSGILLLAIFCACSHSGTRAARADGEDFSRYHKLGVVPFTDPKGQGAYLAEEIGRALEKKMYERGNAEALKKVLDKYNLQNGDDLGAEALMDIRQHAPCDAIVIGSMTPDWTGGRVTMIEATMGEPILRAVIRPPKGKKAFFNPDEVVQEVVKVLTDPKYGK